MKGKKLDIWLITFSKWLMNIRKYRDSQYFKLRLKGGWLSWQGVNLLAMSWVQLTLPMWRHLRWMICKYLCKRTLSLDVYLDPGEPPENALFAISDFPTFFTQLKLGTWVFWNFHYLGGFCHWSSFYQGRVVLMMEAWSTLGEEGPRIRSCKHQRLLRILTFEIIF